ncbi:MAG: hypothetical protein U1E59_08575 [Amaricoccus sp.]
MIHHRRSDGGEIVPRILGEVKRLPPDPPGIEFAVADLFATL